MPMPVWSVTSQQFNQDGTVTVKAHNFLNHVQAQQLASATIAGTASVGPDAGFPGAEAEVVLTLTVTPQP